LRRYIKKKRQPVAVDLTKKDWPAQIRKAASAGANIRPNFSST
jgi:hypothetical protein